MDQDKKMVGQQFASYAKWRKYLDDFQRSEQQIFVVHKSDKLPIAAHEAELSEIERKNAGPFYKNIVYNCKFGGNPRQEATGLHQSSTYKQNCSARIRVGLSKDHTTLEVKAANLCHSNHQNSKVFFEQIPENRRLSPESQKQTLEALTLGCNKKLVQTKLLQDKNKHVTLKDLSNLKAKLKNVDEDSLPKTVNLLKTKYGATVEILEEEKNFKGLFFVTEEMKLSMSRWFHIVFIDGTYKLLKTGLTLMLLIVQDSNALSAVVGVGLLASEDRPTLTWMLQSFKNINPEACDKINCFMSDKDLLERDVLKELFPETPIYICRFHTLRTFSRTITKEKMKISEKEKVISLELLQKLVYSSSESMYDEVYRKFAETVPKSVLEYFNDNWHGIREDWTTYSMVHGNLNNMTNNRLESMNAKIKQVVPKNSTLVEFVERFFTWLQSHNLGVKAQTANTFLKQPVEKFAPGSDRQRYREILMPPSAKRVLEQMDQQKFVKNLTCDNQERKECTIRSNGVDLKVTPLSCECCIWTSEFVPCRHIFSVRNYFNLPFFSNELCQSRCTKKYLMESLQVSTTLQPANTCQQGASSISKAKTQKPVTATQKRKQVAPIITEMLNLAIASCGERFDCRKTLLKDICEAWKEGCEVTIIRPGNKERNKNSATAMDKDDFLKNRDLDVADEVNNNLSLLIDEQCSLSESIAVESQHNNASTELCKTASMDSSTPRNHAVVSDVEIADIKMPSANKIFGRPMRHLATTTGVRKSKTVAKRFADKSNEQKIHHMLSWVVDNLKISSIVSGEYRISKKDFKIDDLKDGFVNEAVNLKLLSPYFENEAFALLKKGVAAKKKRNTFECGHCKKIIGDKSVLCDHCLLWFHYECVGVKRAPKTALWFCPQCLATT